MEGTMNGERINSLQRSRDARESLPPRTGGIVRRSVRRISEHALFARFVQWLERIDGGATHLLRVLTYHRVADPADSCNLYPNILSATPEQFERQMRFIADRYHVLSLQELESAWNGDRRFSQPSVLLTFDDGYRDFAEIAWPVMRRMKLPVTLFVPTAFPNHPERVFWWDRVHQAVHGLPECPSIETPAGTLATETLTQRFAAVKQLTGYIKSLPHHDAMAAVDRLCDQLGAPESRNDILSWNELRQLAREGVTIGAHTRTHPLMNRMSLEEARDEAVGSLHDLEREISGQPAVLAYPAGGCSQDVARMLEREGFRFAFTTERGLNDMRTADPLLLKRINVGRHTSDAALRMQLLRWMRYSSLWAK